MFRAVAACAALVAFAALATADAQVQPSSVAPSPVKRTILQKVDVPGTNLELVYATVEIAPGFKAGRHPGIAMALVVDGEFWFQLDGQPEKVLRAGESLTTPDHAIHNEGALGQAVKLTAVWGLNHNGRDARPSRFHSCTVAMEELVDSTFYNRVALDFTLSRKGLRNFTMPTSAS